MTFVSKDVFMQTNSNLNHIAILLADSQDEWYICERLTSTPNPRNSPSSNWLFGHSKTVGISGREKDHQDRWFLRLTRNPYSNAFGIARGILFVNWGKKQFYTGQNHNGNT